MSKNLKNVQDIYPLAPAQQGMLFHSLEAPGSGVYVEQLTAHLRGDLDVAAFRQAWQKLMERHAVLRTAFAWEVTAEPLQIVREQVALPWEERDWRGTSAAEQATRWEQFVHEDRLRGFDLARAPLFRVLLVRTEDQAYQLLFSHHHILLDGWSLPRLLREMLVLYDAARLGKPADLPTVRPYRDYIAWLKKHDLKKAEAYWRKTLAGVMAATPLGLDRPAQEITPGVADHWTEFDEATTTSLTAVARQNGLTLNTVLQGAWALLLSRYSGQETVVFGQVVSGRPADLPGSDAMIGMFINSLPVRVDVSPSQQIVPWLKAIQAAQGELRQYEHSPLVQVQGWSDVPRGQPMFESLLIFQNYPVDAAFKGFEGIAVESVEHLEQVNYPVMLVIFPGQRLKLLAKCDPSRVDAAAQARLMRHFRALLTSLAANPGGMLGSLSMLDAEERKQVLHDWNDTARNYPHTPVHELFETQAAKSPDAVAVVFGNESWTYSELNRSANRIAHHLKSLGVGPDTLVGIRVDRSLEMIAGLLGILKAGGGYLPLDSGLPAERTAYMLEDARVQVLLTQRRLLDESLAFAGRVVAIDADSDALAAESEANPAPVAKPHHVAYTIYTSGSTGRPKGVQVEHRNLTNFLFSMAECPGLAADDTLLAVTTLSFDIAGLELYLPLIVGARIVLATRDDARDGARLQALVDRHQVTVMQATPAGWRLMTEAAPTSTRPLKMLCGGEAMPRDLADQLLDRFGPELWNLYGPTETTIWSTVHRVTRGPGPVSIGRPIANTQCYVLDPNRQPVPTSVVGELYIGGDGVARGYLNRPELTAEKFLDDPFANPKSEIRNPKFYRTGDLARWKADGTLECLGRVDFQVKVRGFRVELGEIEAGLLEHPGVRQAVAVALDGRLVSYYVPGESRPGAADLAGHLKSRLPEYMVPSAFVPLERLPLSPNGKVDRKALPAPQELLDAGDEYVAPRTLVEEQLAAIWADLLKIERVGANDNFFKLGGHSLLAAKLVNRVGAVFGQPLPIREVFEHPLLSALARRVEGRKLGDKAPPPLTRRPDMPERLPLTSMQESFYFMYRMRPQWPINHIHAELRLTGDLDFPAFERAFNEVVRRHEPLRAVFDAVDDKPFQTVLPFEPVKVPLIDLSGLNEGDREKAVRGHCMSSRFEPFRLEDGPPYRLKLLRTGPQQHIALYAVHHIASDGSSLDVLFRELIAHYAAFRDGRPSPLSEPGVRFSDYVQWLDDYYKTQDVEEFRAYFQAQADNYQPLALATDFPRPRAPTGKGASVPVEMPRDLSEAIRRFQGQNGVTSYMVLLAALDAVLQMFSGQEYVHLITPIANRVPVETESLVGCFIKAMHLNVKVGGDPTFAELVDRVRAANLEAYEKQTVHPTTIRQIIRSSRPDGFGAGGSRVMFMMQNFMTGGSLAQRSAALNSGLKIAPLPEDATIIDGVFLGSSNRDDNTVQRHVQVADLSANFGDEGGVFCGALHYQLDLFRPETAARMRGYFLNILREGIANPNKRLSELPIVPEEERKWLLSRWQPSASSPAGVVSVHQLIEEQARKQPDAVAASLGNERLTYGDLNRRANRLAHYLNSLGIGLGSRVGICLEKSLHEVAAVLAVFKAGAAYVPLPRDDHPRAARILADCGAAAVITQASLAGAYDGATSPVLRIDEMAAEMAEQPGHNPSPSIDGDSLAYVLYTSGSTGEPKGVMVRQAGLLNAWAAWDEVYKFSDWRPTYLQVADFSFDVWPADLIRGLCSGGRLVLCPRELLADPAGMYDLMAREGVDAVETVPVVVRHLVDHAEKAGRRLDFLKLIAVGADVWHVHDHRRLKALVGPATRVLNTYGITEATIDSSYFDGDVSDLPPEAIVPIGRPFPNTRMYVLDSKLRPSPTGVWGEIYIGGPSVALGYLNRPDLTAERFLPDPFEPGGRLYKSGDQGRWRADGILEFSGRLDGQVKVHGRRIETGGIELALSEHPSIQEAVVVARRDPATSEAKLAAYVVLEPGVSLTLPAMRTYLGSRGLARHLIPAAFVPLAALPLLPSGKVNRNALPDITAPQALTRVEYVAPRTPEEEKLCALIGEVLGVQRVGIHDDFFAIGGDSMKAMQVMLKARKEFGLDRVPIEGLLVAPTVAELAARLAESKDKAGADEQPDEESLLDEVSHDAASAAAERLPLVDLQPYGGLETLFLVHGIDGAASPFRSLAHAISFERPVLGLQARGVQHVGTPGESIEEMAEYYLDAIRREQPEGPRLLGGWSMGGLVALEMARRLEEEGNPPRLTVLLDPAYPSRHMRRSLEAQLKQDDTALFPFAFPNVFGYLGVTPRRYRAMGPTERVDLFHEKLHRLGGALGRLDAALMNSVFLTYRAHARALINYTPKPYGGRVLLVKPVGRRLQQVGAYSPAPRWARLLSSVEGVAVPGNHHSMLRGEAGRHLAALLAERFDQLEGAGAAGATA